MQALPRDRSGSFRSWLFAIAHNVVADRHRAADPCQSLALIANLPTPAADPAEAALAAAETASLRDLIARLPPDQRRVVELRFAGLTDGEIARALGRSPGSVRPAQYRAVLRLRRLLGVAEPEERATDA